MEKSTNRLLVDVVTDDAGLVEVAAVHARHVVRQDVEELVAVDKRGDHPEGRDSRKGVEVRLAHLATAIEEVVDLLVVLLLLDAVLLPEHVLQRLALDRRVRLDDGVDELLDVGRQAADDVQRPRVVVLPVRRVLDVHRLAGLADDDAEGSGAAEGVERAALELEGDVAGRPVDMARSGEMPAASALVQLGHLVLELRDRLGELDDVARRRPGLVALVVGEHDHTGDLGPPRRAVGGDDATVRAGCGDDLRAGSRRAEGVRHMLAGRARLRARAVRWGRWTWVARLGSSSSLYGTRPYDARSLSTFWIALVVSWSAMM